MLLVCACVLPPVLFIVSVFSCRISAVNRQYYPSQGPRTMGGACQCEHAASVDTFPSVSICSGVRP